jgi:predicted ATPase/class 3 adenylate cyclase
LTQEQLALQIHCSTSALRKFEAEERRPSAQIAERLAEIFRIPPDERVAFVRFVRGDWQATPTESTEHIPWRVVGPGAQTDAPNPKSHLATFLFTDIEGSAKLWEGAPEQMRVALQRHHAILQEAIVPNGGDVFQIVGDAFCAAFPTVLSAISAAVTAQQELYREPWDLPFPIRVRMGLHTGEAERLNNEYASNPTLNRVARILDAAHGGQVLLSLATKDLSKDSLPVNTELRDMGEHYLKNLMHPEHLFQLTIAGLLSDFPPLNTLTRRHNLPVQLTSFIAHEQEIADVHKYLLNDEIRLVTLIGPPGIGKTRLSVEAARASLLVFPDGVFFVALAPLEDPTLIAVTMAQALGYVEARNVSTSEQLREGIGQKQMLVVLDNCEHLIEAVASLAADLLVACPHLKILATSRESLRIVGEWLYPVPALDAPAFDGPSGTLSMDMESVSNSPALILFAERARAVRPDFAIHVDNIVAIATICARLDGLPLAIELIAARMRLMSPESLLARLDVQFILFADGMRPASTRQKTLNHAIGWSYNLLSVEEQKVFAYLSVFSGGFTLDAAEAIFSQTVTEESVSNLVASLLDKSLLQRVPDQEARNESRYTMLVTIQKFARERLQGMGEETEVRNWHLVYFLDLAEKADQEVHGPNQVEWMDHLDMEHENFRAALDWGLSSGQTEKLLQLLAALSWTWMVRWSPSEYRSLFDQIRALPEIANHTSSYARILNIAVHNEWMAGNFGEARSMVEESRTLWLKLGVKGMRGLAEALYLSGMIPLQEGDYSEALSYFEESLRLYQKCDDKWGMAFARFFLGNIASERDEYDSALVWLKQSLDLFRELGDPWGMARSAQRLGELFLKQGSYEKTRLYFEQHLMLDEGLDFKQGITVALCSLGNLYRYQGDYDQAEQYYEKSLAIGREYSLKHNGAFILYNLGMNALHQNNYLTAKSCFLDYFDVARKQYEKIGACDLLISLAAVASGMNEPERTTKLYGAAQALFETTNYRIPPFDRAEFDRHIQIAREQLGEARFETIATEGRAMTMEQAIAYALEKSDA